MQSQLNVTLLKAVLQAHEIVTTMEQHVSREWIHARKMNAVVEEVKLQNVLQWKQNQVLACFNVTLHSFRITYAQHATLE